MISRPTLIKLFLKSRVATLAVLLIGCSQSLTLQINSEVPVALMQALPLTIAVYYDSALRNHSYIEDSNERENWTVSTGSSQISMIDKVLTSTFAKVVSLAQLPSANALIDADLIVAPSIKEMQFATPDETFFDFYEAWIRYDIGMLAPDGTSLDNWEMVTYGKSTPTRFTSRTTGLNDAIALALRDAGAKLATGLPKQPIINRLLNEN
ncbi:MAG: hypothetical protein VCB07_03440 [Gammaproteobacteria bacterium]